MRIALLSPYSWTYPGGVTRHIESLASELLRSGHEPRILAPFDPDDSLSARLHRGARAQHRGAPDGFVSLGRTVGMPANGAVSNVALTPHSVFTLRRELRDGGYDVAHIHEPVVPVVAWDALCSLGDLPLVGTFHTYSENVLTNGIAALPLGGRRRMNRLHARIAVSEAAAWTARRFYGGRYRIIPNGVHLPDAEADALAPGDSLAGAESPAYASQRAESSNADADSAQRQLRILFIGQAVERKGLPILLHAFEALRDHVPATLTLVGASAEEVAHMMLDDRGVRALGKVSEERKLEELARAQVLCAPSLHGESFGMVLTEAFAAGTTVVASDIPGYRDVVRDGVEGLLVAPGDALALAEALRRMALDPGLRARMAGAARERAERFAWPRVAEEVLDAYGQALAVAAPGAARAAGRLQSAALRYGLLPAEGRSRAAARRPLHPGSLHPEPASRAHGPRGARRGVRERSIVGKRPLRRLGLSASFAAALALALYALAHIGVDRVAASLLASKPGLVAGGFGLMCAAMFARAIAWHAILRAAPTWRRAKRRDAMQGTFIGVLMSATLPARLGEPSRALIVARRLGRARETLPIVLGTMVSQTVLNLLALGLLGLAVCSSVDVLDGRHSILIAVALAPLVALVVMLLAPLLAPWATAPRPVRMHALTLALRSSLARVRDGLRLFRNPRQAAVATTVQLIAWGLQWMSCWLVLMALGLDSRAGVAGAAAVLFAVNVTAVVPATPANVGVFQAACVAALVGVYHIATADAIAYGIVLQAVEVAAALMMGLPALVKEGLSWKDVRLRTMHATPVRLGPLPVGAVGGSPAASGAEP